MRLQNPTRTPQVGLGPQRLLYIAPTHRGGHPVKALVVFHLQVPVQMPGVVDSVQKRGHVEHLRNTKSQDFGQELLQQLWFMADEPRAKGRVLNSVGDSPHSAGAGWTCTHSPPEPLCLSAGLQRDRPGKSQVEEGSRLVLHKGGFNLAPNQGRKTLTNTNLCDSAHFLAQLLTTPKRFKGTASFSVLHPQENTTQTRR